MAAGHGGHRLNSGRKPTGALKIAAQQAALQKAEEKTAEVFDPKLNNMSPLDVMLYAMKKAIEDENIKEAVQYASYAAPYVHSKMPIQNDVRVTTDAVESLTLHQINTLLNVTDYKVLSGPEGTDDADPE